MMRRTLIVLLALGLALSGCGGVDNDTAPEPATTIPTVTMSVADAADTTTSVAATTPVEGVVGTTTVPWADTTVVAATDGSVRSITIGGMGAEYAEPVRCVVGLSVTSRRPTVEESGRAAAASAAAMTEALTAAGVEPSNIQTSDFWVDAYYDDYPNVAGYETRIGYRVAMPDIDGIGAVLASAVAAGGDDVRASGVRFEADAASLLDAARAKAWADAKGRAQSLAVLAGEPLGEVLDVHEKVLITSSHGMVQGGEGDSAQFDIPMSPGVSGVVVLLTATFAIGD